MEFKIGDKVMEISTGDVGIVVEATKFIGDGHINILWETGEERGLTLHIPPRDIKHIGSKGQEIQKKQNLTEFEISIKKKLKLIAADMFMEDCPKYKQLISFIEVNFK